MKNILKLNKISSAADESLPGYNLTGECADPDGILVRSYDMADYDIGDGLLAVGRCGAGVNNIPLDKMAKRGVVVFNTPGENANAVKELVICGLLLASRDILGAARWVNSLETDVVSTAEKGKAKFAGGEILGKTLGVIGLGAVGFSVANACASLGMKVAGYDPYLSDAGRNKLDKAIKIVSLEEIFKNSDYITMHVPLNDSTRNIINSDNLKVMKDGVKILNFSRSGLVDVPALKAAIKSGKVKKYVVDFPDGEVINSENIIVFPHLGASTAEAEDNCARAAAVRLRDYIENGNIKNSVNFPDIRKEFTGKVRTCVLFKAEDRAAVEKTAGDKALAVRGEYGCCLSDGDKEAEIKGFIPLKVRVIAH